MLKKIALLLAIFQAINGISLPASFKKCKVAPEFDNIPNACMKDAVESAIQQLANGNSQLGAMPLDPLPINRIYIDQSSSSTIPIKLTFTNSKLSGFKDLKIQHITGKLSSPENFILSGSGTVPMVSLIGGYEVNGKVLALPITGNGKSEMKLENAVADFTIKASSVMKGSDKYLKVSSFKLNMKQTSRLTMQLTNLFNGNKELGDNMNKFLNENWSDIYGELRPSIENAFAAVFLEYTRRIVERIPFKEIFSS